MDIAEPVRIQHWRAELALDFERRGERTVLAQRRHEGPLVVQKPLYPEGEAVCHSILVHPPGGIAGGDELVLDARIAANAHALLTTPAASKWYRSIGARAKQCTRIQARAGGCVEWLPQENILFDGARADVSVEVELDADAVFIGWDTFGLGRTGAGETFQRGECLLSSCVRRDGKIIWFERGLMRAGDRFFASRAGLDGHTVFGTLVAAGAAVDRVLVDRCRTESAACGRVAVTQTPGVLIVRYVGDATEEAREYFQRIWRHVRPALAGRPARLPRIWNT
jgi:urease accessory protein